MHFLCDTCTNVEGAMHAGYAMQRIGRLLGPYYFMSHQCVTRTFQLRLSAAGVRPPTKLIHLRAPYCTLRAHLYVRYVAN